MRAAVRGKTEVCSLLPVKGLHPKIKKAAGLLSQKDQAAKGGGVKLIIFIKKADPLTQLLGRVAFSPFQTLVNALLLYGK